MWVSPQSIRYEVRYIICLNEVRSPLNVQWVLLFIIIIIIQFLYRLNLFSNYKYIHI